MISNLLSYFIPCCLGDYFLGFESWIGIFFSLPLILFLFSLITVLDDHMVVQFWVVCMYLSMRFHLV
jgi:hypothetical protein